MAAHWRVFQVLACLFLFYGLHIHANLPSKCQISTYSITNWTWKVIGSKREYYINVCGNAKVKKKSCPSKAAVCSPSSADSTTLQDLGSKRQINATRDSGFDLIFTGGHCNEMGNNKAWETNIFMRCGKFLGSPQFVDLFVGKEKCVAVFEFVTNEACKTKPGPEIPCSLYGTDKEIIDLTPLIKTEGGHEVSSSDGNFVFYINVCRGIKPKKDDNIHCPANSSVCRVDKNFQKPEDVGSISYTSGLILRDKNDIVLVYNTTKTVSGCPKNLNPATTITFRCPGRNRGGKGPVLTGASYCAFEVLWETEFACAKSSILETTSCVLSDDSVHFNMTKLAAAKEDDYQVYYNDTRAGSTTQYIYYINVCRRLSFPCEGSDSTVCQEVKDGSWRKSLGIISKQTLRYADGQLSLTYEHGSACRNGLNRTTIIMFICNYTAEIGTGPVFNSESYCFYYFNWETRYACPPSRRTGTQCRVVSPSGVRYDLSELVRMENSTNWIAVDGESISAKRNILINVCGHVTGHPEAKQCDSSAAICMIDQSKGKVVSLGKYTEPPTLNPDNSIKLVYIQGSECKKDNAGKSVFIRSTITFLCQTGDLSSPPVLVTHTSDECHYEFMWRTAAACSLGLNVGQDCRVEDKDAGYVFDLTPLAKKTWGQKDFVTAVNNINSQYKYRLKVCGGSSQMGCVGANVSSCQITQPSSKHNFTLGLQNKNLYYYDGMLNLTYHNGEKCHNGVSRKTHITFLCNQSAVNNGVGVPEFEKENHCIYNFMWFTKYACPAKVVECVARTDVAQYDLTSLVRTSDNWEAAYGANGKFYINVCRSLNLVPGCSGTAAVCLKENNKVTNLGSVSNPPTEGVNNVVITYTDGDKCKDRKYQTKITFLCEKGEGSSSPEFIKIDDDGCTYIFHWKTAAGCPIENVQGSKCTVSDPKSDTIFNLIPLTKKNNVVMYSGNMTENNEQATFQLNVCGALPAKTCGDREDIGACLIKKNGKKIALGKKSRTLYYKGEIVTLIYSEGDNFESTGEQREVHIRFYCDSNKPFGEPTFSERGGNKYFFDFQTSLVCSASAVQCLVSDGGVEYDLSPLGLTSGNWEAVDTREENKHLHYFINVCRAVNPSGEALKCPGGPIGGCQIDHSQKKGFNLGYVQSNPQITSKGELSLQYSGGTPCHKNQFSRSLRIVFSCSKRTGSPIFMAESPECEYLFSWETPSACPLTKEVGYDCKVEDKQYGYMFDLSVLYNKTKDYNVSVRGGAPGERIILNVCNKLVGGPKECHGETVGACIIGTKKVEKVVLNKKLTYYNGQIQTTYGENPAINITFECNQQALGLDTGPTCEKKSNTYDCHWQTPFVCRPMISLQCSIRDEEKDTDNQYDFSSLSKSDGNWRAKVTGPNLDGVSFFINVCRTVLLKGAAAHCPPTSGVCKVQGGTYHNLGTIRHGPRKREDNIYLDYEEGGNCGNGKKYSTHILMMCGEREGGLPVFINYNAQTCEYNFLWTTSEACPVNDKKEITYDNCTAVNPYTKVLFDLNRLRNKVSDYEMADKRDYKYKLNVCGPLVKPPKGCGAKSGVCQVGQQTYNAGISNRRLHFDDGILYLNLSGGDPCHHVKKNRETIIQFVCSPSHGSQDLGKPVFVSENDCTYFVVWHTSLVCERQYECAAFQNDRDGTTVQYSLSRLMRTDANWEVIPEDGKKRTASYYVNLCRPLLPMPGINCPAGAWACKVWTDGLKNQQYQDLGKAVQPPVVVKSGEVNLVYTSPTKCSGDPTDKPFKEVSFKFRCSYGELGHPVLESEDKCIIHISWATVAACPNVQKVDLENCRVFDNGTGQVYSLKPLLNSPGSHHFTVGNENDPTFFYLSVCEPLKLEKGRCEGDGVCMVTNNGTKSYKSLGRYEYRSMSFFREDEMLILQYCNKECKDADVKSKITFICDRKQTNRGQPQIQSYGKNGADFIFRTNLVCPPLERVCSYSDSGTTYDLQLLTSLTGSWNYTTSHKDRFWINICRGISDGPKGCPSSASVCMIRAGQDKVNVLGLTSTQMISFKGGKLQLTYTGLPVDGCRGGVESKVVFYFDCGNHVGQPSLSREEWQSCVFVINWKSSVACSVGRKKIDENNCVIKHPVTGRSIDLKKLVNGSESTWRVIGQDEHAKEVSYYINVCGKLKGFKELPPNCRGDQISVCRGNKEFIVKNESIYYEDAIFSLEMTASDGFVLVINFHCSDEEVGSPNFDYKSSNNHHFFTWTTSIVCAGDLSRDVTDIPEAGHKTVKSAGKKNLGIAFGVVFAVLLIIVFVVVFYKPSRRHRIISCLRVNFKTHVLRKEIKYPSYRYQKLDVSDDDEADSLIKIAEGSDDEEQNDDDDLLPF